jgi:hypothetical protein
MDVGGPTCRRCCLGLSRRNETHDNDPTFYRVESDKIVDKISSLQLVFKTYIDDPVAFDEHIGSSSIYIAVYFQFLGPNLGLLLPIEEAYFYYEPNRTGGRKPQLCLPLR